LTKTMVWCLCNFSWSVLLHTII